MIFLSMRLEYGVQAWEMALPWEHTQGLMSEICCTIIHMYLGFGVHAWELVLHERWFSHGSWFYHGSTPSAQIFPVYLSRIWCPSMGAGSPMGACSGPRYFLYICLGYGVKEWELFIPWKHNQGADMSCIFV
jgi:hypothetical protein